MGRMNPKTAAIHRVFGAVLLAMALLFVVAVMNSAFATSRTIHVAPEPATRAAQWWTVPDAMKDGGPVWDFLQHFWFVRNSGASVRVEGHCASACGFLLTVFPRHMVCATPGTIFGFHEARSAGAYDPAFTEWMFSILYPPQVRDLMRNAGWDGFFPINVDQFGPFGMVWVSARALDVPICRD